VVHHTPANEPIKYLPTKPLPRIRRWLLLYRYTISKKFTYTPNVKLVIRTFVQLYSIVSAFGIHVTSHHLFRATISFGRCLSVSISTNYQAYKFKKPPMSSSPKCYNFLVNVEILYIGTSFVYSIVRILYILCFIILPSTNIISIVPSLVVTIRLDNGTLHVQPTVTLFFSVQYIFQPLWVIRLSSFHFGYIVFIYNIHISVNCQRRYTWILYIIYCLAISSNLIFDEQF